MQFPLSQAEKFDLFVASARVHVQLAIDFSVCRARAETAERVLQYGRSLDLDASALMQYEERVFDRSLELDEATYHLDSINHATITVWSSGWMDDEGGREYQVYVDYLVDHFRYQVYITDDRDHEIYIADFADLEEAIKIAGSYPYIEAAQPEVPPTPSISRNQSDAAGDVVVSFKGRAASVRDLVETVLTDAAKGDGLHYELFAKRAAASCKALTSTLGSGDRCAMESYLTYQRY